MHIDGKRFGSMGQGAALSSASSSNYSWVGLYNNDTRGRALAVLTVNGITGNYQPAYLTTVLGSSGTLSGAGLAYVPSGTGPAGQIYYGTLASLPALTTVRAVRDRYGEDWPHDWPLAILPGGFMLQVVGLSTNDSMYCGFTWAVLEPEELAP